MRRSSCQFDNDKSACKKRSRLLPVDDLAGNNADWLRNHSITISQDRERHYGHKCQSSYRLGSAYPRRVSHRQFCGTVRSTGTATRTSIRPAFLGRLWMTKRGAASKISAEFGARCARHPCSWNLDSGHGCRKVPAGFHIDLLLRHLRQLLPIQGGLPGEIFISARSMPNELGQFLYVSILSNEATFQVAFKHHANIERRP